MSLSLIVGGESLIGRALAVELNARGQEHAITTHRRRALKQDEYFLELSELKPVGLRKPPSVAYICAGVTSIAHCERNPQSSREINVTNTVSLIRSLLNQGAFVVYLSSNAVFDGKRELAQENSATNPRIEYGKQKLETENLLRAASAVLPARVAVVRISKVVSASVQLFKSWMEAIATGESCSAFSNVVFSPVSVRYAISLLLAVGQRREPGIYHCSGAADVSYYEFVKHLCRAAGVQDGIVVPEVAGENDVIFSPEHSSLGMEGTRRALAIRPQSLESAIADMWLEYRAAH